MSDRFSRYLSAIPRLGHHRACLVMVLVFLGGILGPAGPARKRSTAPSGGDRIQRIINQRGAGRYNWGISAVRLPEGKPVYALNSGQFLVPASILKLVTGWVALETFGPDFCFSTEIATTGKLESDGVLRGPLIIRGGGDPTWSFRFYDDDYEKPVKTFVDAILKQVNLKKVAGDLIADDTLFRYEPYGPSWSWEDFQWGYGVRVSALSLNDNVMLVRIKPAGKTGERPTVETAPPFFAESIRNETVCRPEAGVDDLVMFKPFDLDTTYLSGFLPVGGATQERRIAVTDPALYAGRWIATELQRRGIEISGRVLVRHRTHFTVNPQWNGDLKRLALVRGLPLSQVLDPMMKKSVNLYAELLLRELGLADAPGDPDARLAGVAALAKKEKEILQLGVNAHLVDGSGLGHSNLITSEVITGLLAKIYKTPKFAYFRDLLPASGVDGTLKLRLNGIPRSKVFAKTGQLDQVNSMAGYIQARSGRWLAFCVMVNNHPSHKWEARETIDDIVERLYADN